MDPNGNRAQNLLDFVTLSRNNAPKRLYERLKHWLKKEKQRDVLHNTDSVGIHKSVNVVNLTGKKKYG